MRVLRDRPRVTMILLAALPLASGASLIVHVLSDMSLGLALLAAAIIVALCGVVLWVQLPTGARIEAKRRLLVGAACGVVSTVVYDAIRWLLVTVLHWTFWPFDIFPIFGQAIVGTQLPGGTDTVIGVVYHYTNGVMFAVAYTMLFGTVGWWTGILWALGLEALMLSIYPGWLHPKAFGEFVSVSMLGHVAYGTTLGLLSRRLLISHDRLALTRLLARVRTDRSS